MKGSVRPGQNGLVPGVESAEQARPPGLEPLPPATESGDVQLEPGDVG